MIKLLTFLAFLSLSVLCQAGQYQPEHNNTALQETLKQWIVSNYPQNITVIKASAVSKYIIHQSQKMEIDLELMVGVIATESEFKTTALSKEGAKGLMQVIAKWHRDKVNGRNLADPKVAIEVGSMVLKDCLDDHNQNRKKALACYSGSSIKAVNAYYTKVLSKGNAFSKYLFSSNVDKELTERTLIAYSQQTK